MFDNELQLKRINDDLYVLVKKDGSKIKDNVTITRYAENCWQVDINTNYTATYDSFVEASEFVLFLYDHADLTDFNIHIDEYKTTTIIELLNKIANNEEDIPRKIWYPMHLSPFDVYEYDALEQEYFTLADGDFQESLQVPNHHLNDTVYIIEE